MRVRVRRLVLVLHAVFVDMRVRVDGAVGVTVLVLVLDVVVVVVGVRVAVYDVAVAVLVGVGRVMGVVVLGHRATVSAPGRSDAWTAGAPLASRSRRHYGGGDVTDSPRRPKVPVTDLDAAIDAVHAAGLRLTAARRLVLEALLAAGAPVASEEIADGLGGRLPRSDPATVHRVLETMEAAGLVHHFHAGHAPGRYVLESGDEWEYLACERCGAMEAVPARDLDAARAAVRAVSGFEARFTHFPIVGLCGRCQAGRSDRAQSRQSPTIGK